MGTLYESPFVIHLSNRCYYYKKEVPHDSLFSTGNDPFIPILDGGRLQTTHVAPGKRLADRQSHVFLTGKDFRDDLGHEFWGPVIQNRRQTDHAAVKDPVRGATCAEARELRVDDELS